MCLDDFVEVFEWRRLKLEFVVEDWLFCDILYDVFDDVIDEVGLGGEME